MGSVSEDTFSISYDELRKVQLNHCFVVFVCLCILKIIKIKISCVIFITNNISIHPIHLIKGCDSRSSGNNRNWNLILLLLLQIFENIFGHPCDDANDNADALRMNAEWKRAGPVTNGSNERSKDDHKQGFAHHVPSKGGRQFL